MNVKRNSLMKAKRDKGRAWGLARELLLQGWSKLPDLGREGKGVGLRVAAPVIRVERV